MWGFALVLVGILLAGAGARVALERPRPLNLAGMLLAPVGLALALLGVGRMLSPSFFGRRPAASGVLRIMPAGDFFTRGASSGSKDDPRGGYRGPLWVRLAGRPVDFVGAASDGPHAIDRDHESWDAITTDELAARLTVDLPVHTPDVILLQVGANDLLAGASPDVVAGRLASLIDGVVVRVPRAQLLVASLVGVRVPNAGGLQPEAIAAVNARLRATVADRAARGEHVQLVDLHAHVGRSAGDFAEDGLHPSERGYRQMAEAWLEALRGRL
jgi:GDSL-like lipase/acylhydrolase family protein